MNPDVKSTVYPEEIFGPVSAVKTFRTEDDAIELTNDTSYALSCKSTDSRSKGFTC